MLARTLLALAAVASLTAFAPAPFPRANRRAEGGLAALQGTWTISLSRPGMAGKVQLANPMKVKIEGSKWTFLQQVNGAWRPTITYQIKLDDKHQPRHIDLVRVANPGAGRAVAARPAVSGIYEVEGNTFRMLYQPARMVQRMQAAGPGGGRAVRVVTAAAQRPASFRSPPSNSFLYTLTRER